MENARHRQTRIVGLDIYRILSVLMIFLFHSHIHIQCEYGIFTPFVSMGAIYMTAFFMLSGFALFLTWKAKDLQDISVIKKFYIKRIIGIVPLYYTVAILYVSFLGKETISQNILLAPVEILGIQSSFDSLFTFSHNGGTWFISCILMCYVIYPFIQEIVKQITVRLKVVIIGVVMGVLLYAPFIVYFFKTSSIYSNPFFRMLEFLLGVIICSLMPKISLSKVSKWLYSWQMILIEFLILVAGVTVGVKLHVSVGNYMLYSWVSLPVFILQIISMSGWKVPSLIYDLKSIRFFSKISYAFFLAQFFVWGTTTYIVTKLGINTNMARIVVSFFLCTLYAISLHRIVEVFISGTIRNKFYRMK
ncbi:Peptidoglycan/LPS O-acetylase OafA/YrhL, contains acyltransferase and SGNH-hydrolase domains [Selenomonas ruminantium]|uniref:Peptidoglycan/LPS O-acetylase OafA/YrhL, contains acyltransferase and SGNH-hydrolase domains n=1 Tax=Selenomonas ruminantium TaxID=971 RepID=A0A1I3BYK0_SELRU|nr:acyltransferase [Selenomonas ruminantium]SFH67260.1 Peptidoglycan/LPS O-acetylase OafA/YrhL, contains acyltransferase and SGNH-hydrolase domains [Selenomonas ruminantium]